MPIIVSPGSTIDWSLTRERLCDKALEKCSRLGVGEVTSAADRNLCLEALDGILKNLQWRGYSFPKTLSSSLSIAITANTQTNTLPADFYGSETITYNSIPLTTPNTESKPLRKISLSEWTSLPVKLTAGSFPDRYYLDNYNVIWLYPVPNQNITLNLYYRKVILDSVAQSNLDLDSPWMLGIVYGIAAEVGSEFGVPDQKILSFEAKWERQLNFGIENEAPTTPDRMTVSD